MTIINSTLKRKLSYLLISIRIKTFKIIHNDQYQSHFALLYIPESASLYVGTGDIYSAKLFKQFVNAS